MLHLLQKGDIMMTVKTFEATSHTVHEYIINTFTLRTMKSTKCVAIDTSYFKISLTEVSPNKFLLIHQIIKAANTCKYQLVISKLY